MSFRTWKRRTKTLNNTWNTCRYFPKAPIWIHWGGTALCIFLLLPLPWDKHTSPLISLFFLLAQTTSETGQQLSTEDFHSGKEDRIKRGNWCGKTPPPTTPFPSVSQLRWRRFGAGLGLWGGDTQGWALHGHGQAALAAVLNWRGSTAVWGSLSGLGSFGTIIRIDHPQIIRRRQDGVYSLPKGPGRFVDIFSVKTGSTSTNPWAATQPSHCICEIFGRGRDMISFVNWRQKRWEGTDATPQVN